MDTLGSLATGLLSALTPGNLLYVFLGVVIGTVIGVLPGLGPTASIALLLPATVGMEMVPSLILLAGIYYGAMYGGSTTSILVNIPGKRPRSLPASTATRWPGRDGPGRPWAWAAFGSFIGGTLEWWRSCSSLPFLPRRP